MTKKLIILLAVPIIFISCAQVKDVVNQNPKQYVAKTEKYGNYTFVMPANFKLREEASIIYKKGNIVRAYLVYSGTGSIRKITDFLDKNLSKLGWKKSSELIGNSAILVYKKNGQMIIYKIERLIGGTYIKVLLTCE